MSTLIIDSSYLIFRSFFAYPDFSHQNQPTGAIYGYLKTILSLLKDYPIDTLIIAQDLPSPTWRHQLHTGYKAGRPAPDPSMLSQIPILQEWFASLTANHFAVAGYEADDIIFTSVLNQIINEKTITRWQAQPVDQHPNSLFSESIQPQDLIRWSHLDGQFKHNDPIYIFSADKDLFQLLIFPNVKIIQTQPKNQLKIFESKDLMTKYGVEANQWLDYRALIGDSSDNLPGAMGIGPKTATNLLQACTDLYSLYQYLELDPTPFLRTRQLSTQSLQETIHQYFSTSGGDKVRTKLIQSYPNVVQSYALSCLQLVPNISITNGGVNLQPSYDFIDKYGLKSLNNLLTTVSQPQLDQQGLLF